mmetsp:Transcript_35589/g.75345  ORF Transcript_35589/g.75345 Transcript_35589/m.75345 type:complete len:571 (-) Transcript_35589:71-1783(-)
MSPVITTAIIQKITISLKFTMNLPTPLTLEATAAAVDSWGSAGFWACCGSWLLWDTKSWVCRSSAHKASSLFCFLSTKACSPASTCFSSRTSWFCTSRMPAVTCLDVSVWPDPSSSCTSWAPCIAVKTSSWASLALSMSACRASLSRFTYLVRASASPTCSWLTPRTINRSPIPSRCCSSASPRLSMGPVPFFTAPSPLAAAARAARLAAFGEPIDDATRCASATCSPVSGRLWAAACAAALRWPASGRAWVADTTGRAATPGAAPPPAGTAPLARAAAGCTVPDPSSICSRTAAMALAASPPVPPSPSSPCAHHSPPASASPRAPVPVGSRPSSSSSGMSSLSVSSSPWYWLCKETRAGPRPGLSVSSSPPGLSISSSSWPLPTLFVSSSSSATLWRCPRAAPCSGSALSASSSSSCAAWRWCWPQAALRSGSASSSYLARLPSHCVSRSSWIKASRLCPSPSPSPLLRASSSSRPLLRRCLGPLRAGPRPPSVSHPSWTNAAKPSSSSSESSCDETEPGWDSRRRRRAGRPCAGMRGSRLALSHSGFRTTQPNTHTTPIIKKTRYRKK